MQFDCGPIDDRRLVNITIPTGQPRPAIGIFISGGLDSALLYYLLTRHTQQTIVPLVIQKTNNTKYFAQSVVNYITPGQHIRSIAADSVTRAMPMVRRHFDYLYLGLIEERAEFLVGWEPSAIADNHFRKSPLQHVNKSHIIDLVVQEKQQNLFFITHTCAVLDIGRCGTCNRCRERAWGFEQLALQDPGVL